MKNDNVKLKIFRFLFVSLRFGGQVFLFSFLFFILQSSVFAVCPLCTIAAAGGIEVTRILGVDDLISSIWIGGLIVSMSFWMADFLAKKNILKPIFREVLSLILFYLLTIPFLYWGKMIGLPGNTFLGIDKIVFGITIGSFVFLLGVFLDNFLRKINGGKVFIYYQKVILPILFLTIISLIFYKIL
jgi:hypothetical protein